jgi:hypothetical protein
MEQYDLSNHRGRTRTEHENKLILWSVLMLIKTYLSFVQQKKMDIGEVSWYRIYQTVAINLHVQKQHVVELCQQLLQDGDILVFGKGECSKRGPKEQVHQLLTQQQVQSTVGRIDEYHADGRTIINRLVRMYISIEFEITLSKMTVSNYFKQLGLTWKRAMNKKRHIGDYRKDLLRTFLIEFNKVMTAINHDPVNCSVVPVCTDESYIHRNH